MKTKVILIALLLSATVFGAYSQNDFLSKLSDNPKVTSVTITKTLLSMAPALIGNSIEGIEMGRLIEKLDQVDIFTSEDKESGKQMKLFVENSLNQSQAYEILMKMKDGADNVVFYVEKENDNFKSLIMLTETDEDYTLIHLKGNFTAKDIQSVTASNRKSTKKQTGISASYGGTVVTRQILEQTGETNLLRAIARKVAGVEYQNGNLIIRGINSLTLSSNPLYVINGVQTNDASYLTVMEVESVEVLKGADASMFGVNGANGVVIINLGR